MWVTPSPREGIWLFPKQRCQPGHHLLPTGTPEAQLLLQMCPQWKQDTAQEADSARAGSWECAARRQQEGASTQIQPTVPESPFGNSFIISKRKPSAAHTTGLS